MLRDLKRCAKCGRELPLSEFYRYPANAQNRGDKSGYRGQCRECMGAANADYKQRNRLAWNEYMRAYRARKRDEAAQHGS